MKEIESKEVKTLGYRLGQLLVAVFCGCVSALVIGLTIKVLTLLF